MIPENDTETIGQVVNLLSTAGGLSFIEQLQISASKPCTKDNQIHLIGVSDDKKTALLTKASCKMWNCPSCAARLTKTWIARIINGCNQIGANWSFLTITSHERYRGQKSVANLRLGWKKLYNRIRENAISQDRALFLAKVFEQHAEGSYHLHVLISVCLGTRWAKDNARECGMGFMAEWHEVENAGKVAGYIAKYSLKNSTIERGGILWPKGLRRIEVSRNWPKLPKLANMNDFEWNIAGGREFQLYMADKLEKTGFQVVDLT